MYLVGLHIHCILSSYILHSFTRQRYFVVFCNPCFAVENTFLIFDLLGCYAAQNGILRPAFRKNQSIPFSRVQAVLRLLGPFKTGQTGCTETLTTDYQSTLLNIPAERKSHLYCRESLKSHRSYTSSKTDFFVCAFPNGCAIQHVVGFCGKYF